MLESQVDVLLNFICLPESAYHSEIEFWFDSIALGQRALGKLKFHRRQ